jgi:hypothetical protein
MFIIGSELCLLRFEMLYELRKYQKQHYRKKQTKFGNTKLVIINFIWPFTFLRHQNSLSRK